MAQDSEYERRFWVDEIPTAVRSVPGELIVQGYFVADEGASLRVRVTAPRASRVDASVSERELLKRFARDFTGAAMTAKAPISSGVRYEAERDLDPSVALALLRHAGDLVAKVRRTLAGGWFVDEFVGANQGLVLAEVEADGPLEHVDVPAYCVSEITDVKDLSNARLSRFPWRSVGASGVAAIRGRGFGPGVSVAPRA